MAKSDSGSQKPDRSAEIRSQLEAACFADSCFDLSALPRSAFAGGAEQFETGICWCPHPLPLGRAVHLASSRLSQQLETFPAWFDALRTFGCSTESDNFFLLTANGTTTDRFAKRIGELFDIPVVTVQRFPKRVTSTWIKQQIDETLEHDRTLWVEPASNASMDELLIRVANEVRVLRVRNRGNIHRAVMERLEMKRHDSNSRRTWVLIDPTLTKPDVAESLVDAGATGWWLYGSNAQADEPSKEIFSEQAFNESGILADQVNSADYAIHWTRRRQGAWPHQHDAAYLDDLIFRNDASDHRALASLRRILLTQRLFASNDLIRATTPVVCFADVLLTEIEKRRTFRSHLGRWDFEPYGIAIRKGCLKRFGARAVIYGDDHDWNRLTDADRPFFQLATGKDGKIDWQVEQEIRVCGDVSLLQCGPDDAIVFVPSKEEAETVAPLSRWPVVVLE